MINIRVIVQRNVAQLLLKGLERLEPAMQKAAEIKTAPLRAKLLEELQRQPGPPKYPLRWASERQRRAFFATNGFGGGIPYRRTGNMSRAWKVTAVFARGSGVIQAENPTPYVRYVQGIEQQPFHLDTGWPQSDALVVKYQDALADTVAETWFEVVDSLLEKAV